MNMPMGLNEFVLAMDDLTWLSLDLYVKTFYLLLTNEDLNEFQKLGIAV